MKVRSKLVSIAVGSVLILGATPSALAQVDWTIEDFAVEPGDPGSWDSSRHQLGDVVFDGATYHMFLVGGQTPLSWDSPWKVGHWTLEPLTQEWEPDPANPVLSPEPGEWDGFTIYSMAVLYEEGMFKMWYGATATQFGSVDVGYATSPDGSTWTKVIGQLPGLEPGDPGAWDDWGRVPSAVLFDGEQYRMWYHSVQYNGGDLDIWRLGTATSVDGITWDKHPEPVMEAVFPWEEERLYMPEVVAYGGGYAMWYSALAVAPSPDVASIGYAVSQDGIHWARWPDNPVLTPPPPCNAVDSFAAIFEGNALHAWTARCYVIAHVTSPLDVVFFDQFETGGTEIWSSVVQ